MPDATQIVLIMTDTQGVNVVGCYGRPEMRTPRIDRLAEQGMRFDRAYTACPVCSPARSAIFTGTYPHTNGIWGNCMPLNANVKTVGQRLQDHGMHAAYIGKYHLDGTDYFGDGICPPGWDADYWYDIRNYVDELSPGERLRWRQELRTPEAMRKYHVTEEFTMAHRCSDRAIAFLSKHKESAFLLVVSYDEPHDPSTCPPEYCDMFEDFEYVLGENADDPLNGKPAHHREWAEHAKIKGGVKSIRQPMYFGCNSFVDYEIGRVLDAVDEYAPDALVIFTSDHGAPLRAHRLPWKGAAMYEETTRVPFIVRWRGRVAEGSVCPYPISQVDITPTILTANGLASPPFLQGGSLLDTFANAKIPERDVIFMEFNRYEVDHDGHGGFQPIRGAFNGRHKLVVNLHDTDELYDLEKDPQEMVNLIESKDAADVRDRLHDRILDWMNRTRDPFRGYVWERRPWRRERRMQWGGPTRPRPDDGYEPRALLYATGLPVEKWEYRND
ncbi:MAG: sulfatase-like hydrolase/transferase [Planctomycetota bacterium]